MFIINSNSPDMIGKYTLRFQLEIVSYQLVATNTACYDLASVSVTNKPALFDVLTSGTGYNP